MSASEIIESALEKTKVRFGVTQNLTALTKVSKASKDLGMIKNVQRYTEKMPKNFEQYVLGKQAIDMLKDGKSNFYNTDKFFVDGEPASSTHQCR